MKRLLIAILAVLSAASALAGEKVAEWKEPATGMSFVKLEKACYRMGTETPVGPYADPFWDRIGYKGTLSHDEAPRHEVCLDAFWLGKHEVSRNEWSAVMGGPGGEAAMSGVTWEGAREFARKLSARTGQKFRLPTEAEWEYACRAGSDADAQAVHIELVGLAWYSRGDARRSAPQKPGQLAPNPFGLHDMLGNVWEWTEDSYIADAYSRHPLYNPVTREVAEQRVIRGGSFRTEARQTRCAVRGHIDPEQSLDAVGFRLVRLP